MTAIIFDTLKYVERLKSAGVDERQALAMVEAQKDVLSEALDAQVATKADVLALETKLDHIETKFETKCDQIGAKFDQVEAKFDQIEAKFEAKFDQIEAKFETKFDQIEAKFDHVATKSDLLDLMKWMIGAVVAMTGIFAAIVKVF